MTRGQRVFHFSPLDLTQTGGVEMHINRLVSECPAFGWPASAGLEPQQDFWADGGPRLLHSHGDRIPPWRLIERFGMRSWVHTLHGTSSGRALACHEIFGLRNYLSAAKEALPCWFAAGIICVSPAVHEQARRHFAMPSWRHFSVIPNGADNPSGDGALYAAYKPYVLFLGRGDDRVKNAQGLIAAWQKTRMTNPSAHLLVAPSRGFPKDEERIVAFDTITTREKSSLISGAAAVVIPSFYEADSIVAWEAMAHGTPVIASASIGVRPFLERYGAHTFIEPRNETALAAALASALAPSAVARTTPLLRSWSDVAKETTVFYATLSKGC